MSHKFKESLMTGTTYPNMIKERTPLTFRLRSNVSIHEEAGKLYLVLAYPLKSVAIHPFWREVVGLLAKETFTGFETILSITGNTDPAKMEGFLMDLARKGLLEVRGVADMAEFPSVSIIIPVHNRPEDMEACLNSLMRLNYPKDKLEVLVVDDASTDTTPDVVSRFPVRLIRNKQNRQAAFCRNLAAQQATGEIVAFIDSDCLADPCWLLELIPAFKDATLGAVGGRVDAYYDEGGLDRYEKVKSSLIMGTWPKRSQQDNPFFYVPSCNLLVRRKLFISLGGFDETLVVGEDVDLCFRISKQGYHLEYRTMGTVYHKHRNQLIPFCKRRFDYGTSEPLLQKMHPDKVKNMVFPPSKTAFWLLALLAMITGRPEPLALGGLIVVADALRAVVRHRHLPVNLWSVCESVIRSYPAFLYHCCSFVSRYYLIFALAIGIIWPVGGIVIIAMHLLAGMVEFHLKKPNVNPLVFFMYFTLEQISYQLGVWYGCIKYRCLMPVNPRIVTGLPARDALGVSYLKTPNQRYTYVEELRP
jgi:mycofactocin system glycosyltransferase